MKLLSERVLITAAGGRLTSVDATETKVLLDAVETYAGFGAEVIVATSQCDRKVVADLSNSNPIGNAFYVSVPDGAKGALATANFALAQLGITSGKLHIAAGDTRLTGRPPLYAMASLSASTADAGALVFPSSDERHSFVSLTESGKVQFVAEKSRVGKWATSGNFYFADAGRFLEASDWCFTNNANFRGNYFVSSALNYFVYHGMDVQVRHIDVNNISKVWSTS